MTSKDDDTLPLPGLSQEYSVVENTVDEDFIPTSQPQDHGNSKPPKIPEATTKYCAGAESCGMSATEIDETLPTDSLMEHSNEKSSDFIPDTETKKQMEYLQGEMSCRRKLPVFNVEDIFGTQSVPRWETDLSNIPGSPALEPENSAAGNGVKKLEDSIPEIFVNDSTETVDLDGTGNSCPKTTKPAVESVSSSFNSDPGRCEETQIFDNSSVLVLDQSGKGKKSEMGVALQKLYLEETAEDEFSSPSQDRVDKLVPGESLSKVAKLPEGFSEKGDGSGALEEVPKENRIPPFKQKQEIINSTPRTSNQDSDSAATETKEIDFHLSVTCLVTFDVKTKKVLNKLIRNVNEHPVRKPKPKPSYIEHFSDNMSDKSKRYSTSSSGSVYSDKTELPFALPMRASVFSDQTDSSEEGLHKQLLAGKKILERLPWRNEYLLPLKMDEIIRTSLDQQDLKRPLVKTSPVKTQLGIYDDLNHLEEVLESSSSTCTSSAETTDKAGRSEDLSEKEKEKLASPTSDRISEEVAERVAPHERTKEDGEGEGASVELAEGLPVFARWTDKRYYSGVLTGASKSERWDVLFDDGTTKSVKEEFIMPARWLKVGALVFALVNDEYEPGQILDVKLGEEVIYEVELDTEKTRMYVKRNDLCLTDLMAGLVKENFKPAIATPKTKISSCIDFDNVLTGKRLREQRTPLRAPTVQAGGSGTKKKSSSTKAKKPDGGPPSETKELKKQGGLKSEDGHLVEDKTISADSPSGNETGDTPLRGISKETRGKAKPRSLSYEAEEVIQRKVKAKNWVAPDGTPIPGPSGVKLKKQKTKRTAGEGEEDETPVRETKKSSQQSAEKSNRKRKLGEPAEEEVQKKTSKEGDTVRRTRNRKA